MGSGGHEEKRPLSDMRMQRATIFIQNAESRLDYEGSNRNGLIPHARLLMIITKQNTNVTERLEKICTME
jgi:hypothetical protein